MQALTTLEWLLYELSIDGDALGRSGLGDFLPLRLGSLTIGLMCLELLRALAQTLIVESLVGIRIPKPP